MLGKFLRVNLEDKLSWMSVTMKTLFEDLQKELPGSRTSLENADPTKGTSEAAQATQIPGFGPEI